MINNIPAVTSTATANNSNDRDSILQLANENPLGIKIKEITKPEEIRITDDKPKPFNPFKSTTTTTTTTTTTSTTTIASTTASLDVTTETEAKTSTESSTITLTTETLKESKELSTEDTNQSPNHGEQDNVDNDVSIDNNSSDAPSSPPPPPPVKALVEPDTLLNSGADSNSIADDASNKSVRQIVEHSTSSTDIDQFSDVNDFSSTTEFSTESNVLNDASTTEHGEEIDLTSSSTPQNVVFVRHGGKTEPFHISGTDGLQRVEELEMDVSSTTENDNSYNGQESTPEDIETSSNDGISSGSSETPSIESSTPTTSEPETFSESGTVSLSIEKKLDKSLESNDSIGIDNLSNNSIEVSTLDDGIESSSEFASSERVYQTVYYGGDEKSSTASPSGENVYDTVYYPPSSTEDSSESSSTIDSFADTSSSTTNGGFSTTDESTSVTATESQSTVKSTTSFEEEPDVTPDENPYYPVDIPVDVSIHKIQEVSEQEEKRRLPSKVLDDTFVSSTVGPTCDECDDVKIMESSSTQGPSPSDQEIKSSHINDIIESRVPGEPHLVPEWERRNSTEKASIIEASTTLGPPNDTETNVLNKTTSISNENNVDKSNQSAALMLETTIAPIDSDEIYGRKEPTTERSTTKGYANTNDSDETLSSSSSSSSAQQLENSTTDGALPDDDAESIKLTSSASNDDDTNESYETRPLKLDIPDSLQNYWRYVSKANGWTI